MADINLANTSSDLSGKTVLTAENAYTVSGLHTFSRSTNPPFAVNSGAGKVTNLDADKLDGQEGSYYLALSNATGTLNLGTQVTGSLDLASNVTGNLPLSNLGSFTFSSWTPTWTTSGTAPAIGNGTLTGTYLQIGKLVFFDMLLTAGSTTTFGTGRFTFTLPATPASTASVSGLSGVASDSSASRSYACPVIAASSTTIQLFTDTDSGASAANVLTSAVPFTWASGDTLAIHGWFRAS